ncbi:glycosyltransferase [Gluconacetobacter sp.]|uniref:glycosyltransferase n=1 Tax=Gluconacetobacter sp. TaxID=1935994 RepID=UPI0039EC70F3
MAIFFSPERKTLALAAASARDAREWEKAASLYKEYLDRYGLSRKTFGYIVQWGNCLKEAQAFDEAMRAYDAAVKIKPDNADVHLQRGHLLKLMGHQADALFSYHKALGLEPSHADAKLEIERLGGLAFANVPVTVQAGAICTIWLDVTDFMVYVQHNNSLSGIQRVIANLCLFIKHFDTPLYRIVPVIPEYDRLRMLAARTPSLLKLVEAFDDPVIDREKVETLIREVYDGREEVRPSKGDILVMAGAFWICSDYDLVLHFRKKGMRFGLFIHDLLQIRMPKYVAEDATERFNIKFCDVLDVSDFVLTNSQYVADDVQDYIQKLKNYNLPVQPILLPTELKKARKTSRIYSRDVVDMEKFEYVLAVSTIEIRKNYELLVECWEKLREEFGEAAPKLVFVGKWGWQIEEFRKYIEDKGYIGDWLFIFNGISDIDLEYLYRHCLFTVYPSFAEGFGLPIGESLAYGKPCIASNTTSMPEVGGRFVRYIDPFDWEASYPIIRQVIADREDLAQWQTEICQQFKPKTWDQFCSEFYAAVVHYNDALQETPCHPNFYLPAEKVIFGGDHDILSLGRRNAAMITFRASRTEGWHLPEHWGVWSAKRRSTITFLSDLKEGVFIELFLKLHHAPSSNIGILAIVDAGCGNETIELSEHPTFFRFTGRVGVDGLVTVNLLARGPYPSVDARGLFIGWSGIAYCLRDDPAALLRTLDAIITKGHPFPTARVSDLPVAAINS